MKEGDAVQLTAAEADIAAGALGVIVETYPLSEPDLVLVEFEGGTRLVSSSSIEVVTAVGVRTAPTWRGSRRSAAPG